jgi:hypothetical protein
VSTLFLAVGVGAVVFGRSIGVVVVVFVGVIVLVGLL